MQSLAGPAAGSGFGATSRTDGWWRTPLLTFLGLGGFVAYLNWAAFQNAYYEYGNYLSPLYSPLLFGDSHHAWFAGDPTAWWPSFLPYSPAFLILWAPAGFRMTCYYYRGAYYKAFWADPPACAVGEPRNSYWGENSFPLIIQNLHRYFLYLAIGFLFILSYDAWLAMWFVDPATGEEHFGIGVGTIVLILNPIFLGGYTLGCHSLRHLIGGIKDSFSGSPARTGCYNCVSGLNKRHMNWAWMSLFWVSFTDFYVRMCAMGIWTDFRIL